MIVAASESVAGSPVLGPLASPAGAFVAAEVSESAAAVAAVAVTAVAESCVGDETLASSTLPVVGCHRFDLSTWAYGTTQQPYN